MEITWLGHSAFLIKGKNKILIDPFLTGNPMASTTHDKISCDVICVTHGHEDHVGDTVAIAKKNKAKVLAIVELAEHFEKAGCETIGFNIGGSVNIGETKVAMTHAIHSSGADAPGLEGAAGAPVGFAIESEKIVYHSGDTALFSDMALIGSLYHPDVAMLPIGGYFTMDVMQAVIAVELIKPKIVIPMHYNTWPPIKTDPQKFKSEVDNISKTQVKILKPGESFTL